MLQLGNTTVQSCKNRDAPKRPKAVRRADERREGRERDWSFPRFFPSAKFCSLINSEMRKMKEQKLSVQFFSNLLFTVKLRTDHSSIVDKVLVDFLIEWKHIKKREF